MLCGTDSFLRENSARRVPAGSSRNRQDLSSRGVDLRWLADVPPAFDGDPSWVISLRAEVESLRKEVRQLREEVEFWKAESHKHFCEAQYWKAMHQQALERVAQRDREIERLKGEVRGVRQQLFGRKTEKGGAGQVSQGLEKSSSGRRRGQQPGQAGHGRRDHSHLPADIVLADLPADERCCPHCHLPYAEFPGTEDSETIEIDVRAHRRVIQRKRYVRTCSCPDVPGIITAPRRRDCLPRGSWAFPCG